MFIHYIVSKGLILGQLVQSRIGTSFGMALLFKPLLQPSLDLHRSPLMRVVGIMRYRLGFTLQARQRGGGGGLPVIHVTVKQGLVFHTHCQTRMFVKIRDFFGVRHRELLRNYLIVDSPIFYRKMSAESLGQMVFHLTGIF